MKRREGKSAWRVPRVIPTMIRLAGAKGIRGVLSAGCVVLSKCKNGRRAVDKGGVKACV